MINTKTLLTAVSVMAIGLAAPAMAESNTNMDRSSSYSGSASGSMNNNMGNDMRSDRQAMNNDNMQGSMNNRGMNNQQAMNKNLNPQMVHDQDGDTDYPNKPTVKIDEDRTAAAMIGEDVVNPNDEAIATVEDIIIDSEGKAQLIVLSEGEWTGMGDMISISYDEMMQRSEDGDVMLPLSEDMIDTIAETFSYDETNTSENMFSVATLMDGYLLNANNEEIADVNNITFTNGEADMLIVDVDENLGITPAHHVAMDIGNLQMVQDDDEEIHFQMSAAQTQTFNNLKQSL